MAGESGPLEWLTLHYTNANVAVTTAALNQRMERGRRGRGAAPDTRCDNKTNEEYLAYDYNNDTTSHFQLALLLVVVIHGGSQKRVSRWVGGKQLGQSEVDA